MRLHRGATWRNQAYVPAQRGAIGRSRVASGATKRVTNVSIRGLDATPRLPKGGRISSRMNLPMEPPRSVHCRARLGRERIQNKPQQYRLRDRPRPDSRLRCITGLGRRAAGSERCEAVTQSDTPNMSHAIADDPLLTPEEVSAMLGGVPPATLKRWRTQRTGPVVLHIGRHVRYRRSAVEVWLREKDREAAAWMAS
jgi:predicted DNA-binding transcriptional regulator AlpA